MAVYVVTGGAGFIGSSIVQRLVGEGETVRVVDNLSTGRADNLAGLEEKVALWQGDLCDDALLGEAFNGADFVLHQAALASVQQSMDDPLATNRVNVEGTLHVLQAARRAGVRRVVCASSCAVYGDGPELPKREDMAPVPFSPYAASKLAGEFYARAFWQGFGLETVSLRYFNVFGPRQDPRGAYAPVVPIFITAMQEGRRPRVYGDGEQSRDFVYVADVVEANLRAARAEGAAGAVLNIGTGQRHTLNELLALLARSMQKPAEAEHLPERLGDLRHSQADIGRAGEALGYKPAVSFGEGLRRTVEWYRSPAGAVYLQGTH